MSNCRQRPRSKRPTKAQDAAFRRLIARDGWKNVTAADAHLLSTHPWLTVSQREALVAKVAA